MVVAQEKIEWQEPFEQKSGIKKYHQVKKRKRYDKVKSIVFLALIVGVTGALGAETIQLTVVKGAQVRSLEQEISQIKEQRDLLQLEADKLRSVSRIESAALSMGMEKPTGTVYMAGVLPALNNQKGAPSAQAESNPAESKPTEAKPTALQQISQIITSFFAITQR